MYVHVCTQGHHLTRSLSRILSRKEQLITSPRSLHFILRTTLYIRLPDQPFHTLVSKSDKLPTSLHAYACNACTAISSLPTTLSASHPLILSSSHRRPFHSPQLKHASLLLFHHPGIAPRPAPSFTSAGIALACSRRARQSECQSPSKAPNHNDLRTRRA